MPFTHTGGTAGRAGTLAMQQKIGKLRKHITELEQVVVERNRHIKQLKDENEKLRAENKNLIANYEMLSDSYMDSKQACEHLFTDLKCCKSLLLAKLPERELMLIDEIKKLLELVHKQDALTKAVHAYWAGSERSLDEFNAMMDANAQVLALMRKLGIEVPE